MSTITGWNKLLAKRRNSTWALASLLYEQHFTCFTILIWAKQNRAMLSKWMPSKAMPLLFKSPLLKCLPLLLTMFQKAGSLPGVYFETIQSTKFETLQNQEVCGCAQPWPSAWVSQPPCDRGTLHFTAEEALEEAPGPVPKASKPRRGDLWPVWGPGSFGSSEHFMYLRLSLLPAFWGRCCSSPQIPCWGDYMPKAACFFPFPCAFTKKETA